MIIELKDIPSQPIKRLDICIEFSDTGVMSVSTKSIEQIPQTSLDKQNQDEQTEQPDIPQEMINADF